MFFMRRQVFGIVINILIVALGVISFFELAVREYPKIVSPIIEVSIDNPGGSCNLLKDTINRPFAEYISGLPGLKDCTVSLNNGHFKAELEFIKGTQPSDALLLVIQAMSEVRPYLPHELKPPVIKIAEDKTAGEIGIGLLPMSDSKTYDSQELAECLFNNVKNIFESIPGVATFRVYGAMGDLRRLAIDVMLDPIQMKSFNVTAIDVMQAIQAANFTQFAGQFLNINNVLNVQLLGDLHSVSEFANIVIPNSMGTSNIVRIKDIAKVQVNNLSKDINATEKENRTCYNGREIAYAALKLQPGANILNVSKELREKMKIAQQAIGDTNLKLTIISDSADPVRASIDRVYRTLIEAIILVFIITTLFIGSARSSIIPIVAIPICIAFAFFMIYAFGLTINVLTLAAIVLAIGLVVDDAIVVIHAIDEKIKSGLNVYDACVEGMKHIQFSVIAMTFTLVAVYLPVAFAGGDIGDNFFEFALTLSGMIVISGVVAIVLTPIMANKLLVSHEANNIEINENSDILQRAFYMINRLLLNFEQLFLQFEEKYKSILKDALNNKSTVFLSTSLLFTSSLLIAKYGLKQIISPHQDKNQATISIQFPGNTRLIRLEHLFNQIDAEILKDSDVDSVLSQYYNGENRYTIVLYLKDLSDRKLTDENIAKKIEKMIKLKFADRLISSEGSYNSFIRDKPGFRIDVRSQKSIEDLKEAVQIISKLLKEELPDNNGPRYSSLESEPNYVILPHYEMAAAYGVSLDSIMKTVQYIMTGNPPASHYMIKSLRYPVRLWTSRDQREIRVTCDYVKNIKPTFDQFYVRSYQRNEKGEYNMVRLSDVIKVKEDKTLSSLQLKNNYINCEISTEFEDKNLDFVKLYNTLEEKAKSLLPDSVSMYPGEAIIKAKENSSAISKVLFIAVVFVYLFAAALFESFISPFVVILTIPTTISGGLIALYLSHNGSLNIWSYIAFLTLIGLIARYGILIVDEYNRFLDEGKSEEEAALLAGVSRFKPIIMTTLAMVFGSIPLMLAHGSGYEVMEQLGLVVVGGLSLGTITTVFLVPCLCTIFSKKVLHKTKSFV